MSNYGCRLIETPIGKLYIIVSKNGVTQVTDQEMIENNYVGKKYLDDSEVFFKNYFKGLQTKPPNIDYEGISNYRRVVSQILLKKINFGAVISYSNLGILANNPRSSRSIGTVMRKNPCPILIPCHRVIKSNNEMGNYSFKSGLETKKWLLEHEGIMIKKNVVCKI